jgi:hypothetical protein
VVDLNTNDAKKKKTKNEMIALPKPRFTNISDNPLSMMNMGWLLQWA